MNTVIWNAVSMFISSPTGRGLRGTAYQASLAKRAAAGLRREIREGDIRFCKWLKPLGQARQFADKDIIIFLNPSLRCDLAGASLMLVHEAVHHRAGNKDELTEELNCRRISVLYFQDLVRMRWKYNRRNRQTALSVPLLRGDRVDGHLQMSLQESFEAKNQLVDFVLAGEGRSDSDYKQSIDAGWVKQNMDWWGGLANRWPGTRGFYVKLLARQGQQNALLIKRILESLFEPFHPADGYTKFHGAGSDSQEQQWISFGYRLGGSTGWQQVRSALAPLLNDPRQRAELERLDERLGGRMGISPPPTL
jgi:hypothetical protein